MRTTLQRPCIDDTLHLCLRNIWLWIALWNARLTWRSCDAFNPTSHPAGSTSCNHSPRTHAHDMIRSSSFYGHGGSQLPPGYTIEIDLDMPTSTLCMYGFVPPLIYIDTNPDQKFAFPCLNMYPSNTTSSEIEIDVPKWHYSPGAPIDRNLRPGLVQAGSKVSLDSCRWTNLQPGGKVSDR
jgi:hypothetical protein